MSSKSQSSSQKNDSGPWSRDFTWDNVDQEVFDSIIHRMSNGEALTAICRSKDMPDYSVFMKWIHSSDKHYQSYSRARELQSHFFADENVEIADTDQNPQRARNRMDARRWHASKMNPKKYGERVHQELSGINGGPIEFSRKRINIKKLTPEEREHLKSIILNSMSKEA